ncbi:MAG: hypothetical protein CMP76_04665 [Flavobacterium sp.]|uniref:hypothetical protein n=1 Tax=Flavobacterium sp. TaxID=239 RepID=UPI000C665133|nr:hypothetical protein [Flavobacterium sp.]MBF02571.1 hypothetical protein [Flavobacterium sp.]|tara:strand:- start:1905 stop:2522 length:618 start_codon:yes stop_codon:yes gene_type:complete
MKRKYTEDSIQALEAGEHIRMRPKMYFEKCFSENLLDSLPFEVLCHAFDEYFDGNCKEIKLTVWEKSFSIIYNVGIPLSTTIEKLTKAEIIMTKIGACSNLKKHLTVGQEFCSLGMATINFASENCKLTTVWNDQKGTFEFKDGETISRNIEQFKSEASWTEIYVHPNKLLFETLHFTSKGIEEKATEIRKRLKNLSFIVENKIS